MASKFQEESLKIVVAQICQNIGFQGIFSTPLEVLIDLLHRHLKEIAVTTHRYSEHYGRTQPTIDDLGLAFRDLGISISDLEEYVTYVEPISFAHKLPKIPVQKSSNLNFLKPGAREILSRPLYVHEHLPPMYPEKEEEEVNLSNGLKEEPAAEDTLEENALSPSQEKRPAEGESSPTKKLRTNPEDEGEPVREIDSVMMTTSGYISSAREGKMPEAKRPTIPMAIHHSGSPLTKTPSSLIKIIRHKNHHGGVLPSHLTKTKLKHGKVKPKLPTGSPGTGSLKRLRSPSRGHTPKLKIPNVSKDKEGSKKEGKKDPSKKEVNKEGKKDPSKKEGNKEGSATPLKKKSGEKDGEKKKKDKEGKEKKKKDKKTEGGKKTKDERKEQRKEGNRGRERTRIRMRGLSKEEELRRYKARENELIAALAASSAVTVTSIPPPSLRVREKTPETPPPPPLPLPLPPPSDPTPKNKLSVFRKFPKGLKEEARDSSPDLMIDDVVIKEERPSPPLSPCGDFPAFSPERGPLDMHIKNPVLHPQVSFGPMKRAQSPQKVKEKRVKSPKEWKHPKEKFPVAVKPRVIGSPFSPSWRSPSHMGMPLDRPRTPKTPEPAMSTTTDDLVGNSLFTLGPFPHGPSLIPPPFSRFPFLPPFGVAPRPPLPDMVPIPHMFLGAPPFVGDKRMFEEGLVPVDRPPTPSSHDLGSGFMDPPGPSFTPIPIVKEIPPPPVEKLHPPPPPPPPLPPPSRKAPEMPLPPPKQDKVEKEKKKEHKKERKVKEKEKTRKKKDKKDKEKAKEEKKKEKKEERERLKQERKKEKKTNVTSSESVPKITLKLQSEETSTAADANPPPPPPPPHHDAKATPKLVIKPVVKPPPVDDLPPVVVEKPKKKKKTPPLASPPQLPSPEPRPSPPTCPGSPPEIAKFSALITRPPKSSQSKKTPPEVLTVPPLKIKDGGVKVSSKKELNNVAMKTESKESLVPPLKIKSSSSAAPSTKISDDKKAASKKSEKKEKKKSAPLIITTTLANVEPIIKLPPPIISPPPQLPPPIPIPSELPKTSKKSATGPGAQSSKSSSGLLTETVGPIGHFVDDQGNEVWICPTCGKQDDGSPMIGCDTCDDWYHWLCVGIHVPPSERENWYCPRCLSQHKQQRGVINMEKKKRGRKRKII